MGGCGYFGMTREMFEQVYGTITPTTRAGRGASIVSVGPTE
jgi:hypothetical protein